MSETEKSVATQAIAVRQESTVLDIDLGHVAAGLAKIKSFQALVRQQLMPEHDFGTIPGTSKPSLWKPGAEKLCKLLGLADSYIVADKVEDWERGMFHYQITCELRSIQNGVLIAQGLGSCNSKESRYRYRWVFGSEVPTHIDKKSLPTKNITTRRGNKATLFRVENEDPFSLANTLLKMAKKRAMVDAVLSASRLSDVFSQGESSAGRGEDESIQGLKQRREQMLSYFKSLGVQSAQVFDLIGVVGIKSITSEHLATLKQIAANIKEGIGSVEDFFSSASEAQSDKSQDSAVDSSQDTDNEKPEAAQEEAQGSGPTAEAASGSSELDKKKAKLVNKIVTELSRLHPGNTPAEQAASLRTLKYIFGQTVIDDIAKLPAEILKAGLGAMKSREVAAETEQEDIPV